ncbi:hypothetical protein ScPMuIL_000130 [Solemya velum]
MPLNILQLGGEPFGTQLSESDMRVYALKCISKQRTLSATENDNPFTVTPVSVTDDENQNSTDRIHPPLTFDIADVDDNGDTFTNNSITALLSSKFRDIQKRIKQYGLDSPRFRKRLVSKWESLNYDICENELHLKEQEKYKSKRKIAIKWVSRWIIMFLVGVGTALLAGAIHYIVEEIGHHKFDMLRNFLDRCAKEGCLYQPVLIWMAINLVVTITGACLVTYVQPVAAGSGIPFIKSYLNGVKIPGLLSLRAFVAKTIGVVLSILGGLACGKEGPMAHSGGIIAAGLGKGRIRFPGDKQLSFYDMFRDDHEIRDFVAGGAASGVSAAFGAPVGGTLFSVEEAASFWNQELTWRVFFSAMIACFGTNFLISAFSGHPTELSAPGLVRFNVFPDLSFDLIEIPVFLVMAVIGGLIGAAFVVLNYKLTVFRQKFLRKKWIKVLEAGIVASCTALAAFILMYSVNDCTDKHPTDHHSITSQMFCDDGKHNSMSNLFLTTPEGCLKALLHDPYGTFQVVTLLVFVVVFFFLGVWTYGLSVSSGVFIPSLVIGAAWGRMIGIGVVSLFPEESQFQSDVGKYALIGAACQLGGILRTTISLTVIIVECTGDISFGLPIMIVLMISKWVGDFITTGLYDMNVEVCGIPLLPWEPPPLCDEVKTSEVMSQPLTTFQPVENVGKIIDVLKHETCCGFPIVKYPPEHALDHPGKLKGLILRSQLTVLLKKKIFCQQGLLQPSNIHLKDFRDLFPDNIKINDIHVTEEERGYVMDLTSYMNPTPYTIEASFSLTKLFKLFRGLGLRHIIVVNSKHEPVGMVTRKDLAKFRAEAKRGLVHIEHLKIEDI